MNWGRSGEVQLAYHASGMSDLCMDKEYLLQLEAGIKQWVGGRKLEGEDVCESL